MRRGERGGYDIQLVLPIILLLLAVKSVTVMAQPAGGDPVNLRDINIPAPADVVAQLYQSECAVCHGDRFQGAAQGTPLVGVDLFYGDTVDAIAKSTGEGSPDRGMPAWSDVMTEAQIHALALYITEQRQGTNLDDFRYNAPLIIPKRTIKSEKHDFRIEAIIAGLDPLPYSIALLPGGQILLTEKTKGLSIVARGDDGTWTQSPLIAGTPQAYDDSFNLGGQPMGLGWLMDVALHPDYETNGWIYLHFGDRCSHCNAFSRQTGQPVSMNKLVRGRIKDGDWIDEEVIWQAGRETYTFMPEIAAGGRVAFDDDGYVYFSIGMKGPTEPEGVQDLSFPYGKIMRLHDDGRIPLDNPFVNTPGAEGAIWTIGHRSPQGLEFNRRTGVLWGTEMGPRGGDEVNLLERGQNYGWPLVSFGVNYDGTSLTFAEQLGIPFDPADLTEPVVDLTPAPAISSFIFYNGDEFSDWRGDILVGSLRASDLFRMEVKEGRVVHTETLISDLARFRDIEQGPNGEIYILLEHDTGGRIIRLVATDDND